jgi:RHS repeat-associated protein
MVGNRKAKEKIFYNQDGTYTKKIYNQPVHFKKGEKWEEISTKIVEKDTKSIKPERTMLEVEFAKEMNKGKYTTFKQGEHYLDFSLQGASGPSGTQKTNNVKATYEENKVWYKNIFPEVDLRNIVFNEEVKEDIILQKFSGYNSFVFEINTNLSPVMEKDGSMSFLAGNEKKFTLPKPIMSDSNIDAKSGESSKSEDIYFKLESIKKDKYSLTLVADQDWLKSPKRVYPVYLDPTVTKWPYEDFDNAYVSSAYRTTNYSGSKLWDSGQGAYLLKVGHYDSTTGNNWAYLKQDLSELNGANIIEAKLWLYCLWSYYPTTPTGVWLGEVVSSWNPSTITWDNSPSATTIATAQAVRNSWTSFDVKNTVQKWANTSTSNYGFAVHTNGNGQTYWKKFVATENYVNSTSAIPELTITYSFPDVVKPTVVARPDSEGTGYLDISWSKVTGATSYSVGIHNGKDYQYFDVGNVNTWSTKGEAIWPTDTEIKNGKYNLHYDGAGSELLIDPSPVYKNAYANSTTKPSWIYDSTYWVVIKANYQEGSISTSPYTETKIPVNKPTGTTYAYPQSQGRGHIALNWTPVNGADKYKVLLYNGVGYEAFDAGKETSWSTEGKKLWPTDSEITNQRYLLHTDGQGSELPIDPSPVYRNSGGASGTDKDYWIKIAAYNSAGVQIGVQSDYGTFRIPDSTSALGMEDYWASIDVPGGKVNAFNGNLVINETDFSLTGNGPDIVIARTYNSQDTEEGLFGKGWFSTLEEKVKEESNGDILYTTSDKTIHRFVKNTGTTTYTAPSGIYLKITKDQTTGFFTLEDKDKTKIIFKADGKIKSEIDGHGKTINYEYNATNMVSKITDATGKRSFTIVYKGNFIDTITGPGEKVASYQYDTLNNLILSKTPGGREYRYKYYDNSSLLEYLYDPEHTDTNDYKTHFSFNNGRVEEITDSEAKTTIITYKPEENQVIVTDPKHHVTTIKYNLSGNLVESAIDPAKLNLKTTYEYLGNNLIKTITPKSQVETVSYDNKGNVTSVSDPSGTSTAQYNSNNDLIKSTDNENRTTTVVYKDKDAVSVTDNTSLTSSVSMHDAFGNITAESSDYATGYNLLKNAGMEEGNSTNLASNWAVSSSQATGFGYVESKVNKMGNSSLYLTSTATSVNYGYTAASQIVQVQPNTTYTFSGFMKTGGIKNANVLLEVTERDANNNKIRLNKNDYSKISATMGSWTKRQVTFTTDSITTSVIVWLTLEHSGDATATGEAWFDSIQLEKGPVSSSYNPVSNSSFEENSQGVIPYWIRSCGGATNCGDGKNNVSYQAFEGNYSLFLERTNISHISPLYGNKIVIGQDSNSLKSITLTGMSKSENVTYNDSKELNNDYALMANVHYNDGTAVDYYAKFPLGSNEWNRAAVVIQPKLAGINYINVYVLLRGNNKGKAWFDDIRLIEGNILSQDTYDEHGYLKSSTDEEGNKSQYTFDEYGNKKQEINAKGQLKGYEYDSDNQLTKVTLPNKTTISYEYDKNGNIKNKVVEGEGLESGIIQLIKKTTNYAYFKDNKLKEYVDSLGKIFQHQYDDNGNKIRTITPNGKVLEWAYDNADRLTSIFRESAEGILQESFRYELDGSGNQKKVYDFLNNITYDYLFDETNKTDRLLNAKNSLGGDITWSYHDSITSKTDKVKEITIKQGSIFSYKTSYSYNSLDQNTKVVDGDGKYYSFDYSEEGNVETYTAGNGAGSSFIYDHSGKVVELTVGTKQGEKILSSTYEYDQNGNRTKILNYNGPMSINYEYDSMNQLLTEISPNGRKITYKYDGFGNRTFVNSTELKYNEGNQLTKYGSEIIEYDDNGNRKFDGRFNYRWDAADQLTSVTKKGETTPFAEYRYDDDGRRIEKKVRQTDGSVKTTRYFYDGSSINVLYETDETGNMLRNYIYSADGIRVAMKSQNKTFYYHYNPHGDVVGLTDNAGNIVARYEYDAWGNVITSNAQEIAADNPFGYAGYMYDQETSMYYLMARYYHPKHGVFISVDPDPGDDDDPITQNGYSYSNNNPVMNVDPDGHFFWLAVNAGFAVNDGYKAYMSGGWKAAALAVGIGLVGGAGFKAGKAIFRAAKTKRLAKRIASSFNGTLTKAKGKGWKVIIPDGKRPFTVRIMRKGGIRNNPYYKISKDRRGAYDRNGTPIKNRESTHINITKNSYAEISNIINKHKER